jgi:hypothetical protein
MASFVPEPTEKCAVCAASPSSTTLPCRQLSFRTVVKLIHRELLPSTVWPASRSANSSRIRPIEARSDSPGLIRGTNPAGPAPGKPAAAPAGRSSVDSASKPARRHTVSCSSTMNVLPHGP